MKFDYTSALIALVIATVTGLFVYHMHGGNRLVIMAFVAIWPLVWGWIARLIF